METIEDTLPVNTEVKGKIAKCIPKGVLVDIEFEDTYVEDLFLFLILLYPK